MRVEHQEGDLGPVVPRGLVTVSLENGVPVARRSRGERDDHLRVGIFETSNGRQHCLIRNISRSGARVRVHRRYRLGTRAVVDLKTGHRLSGTVIWAQMGHVGLEFDEHVDVENILSTESLEARGQRARLPRVECRCPVTLRHGGGLVKAEVLDISQGGIKARLGDGGVAGRVIALLPDLYPMNGEIRWNEHGLAGLAFDELIPFRRLLEFTRAWSDEERAVEANAA